MTQVNSYRTTTHSVRHLTRFCAALALVAVAAAASAQDTTTAPVAPPDLHHLVQLAAASEFALPSSSSTAPATPLDPNLLPDAPTPQATAPAAPDPGTHPASTQPVAPLVMKYIPAGWRAQPLSPRAKFAVGFRDIISPEQFGGVFLSAGWEQLLNSEPNYGTDRGAFGERLGASAIRDASEGIFTDGVFASLFHEDPRYYVEGPGHSFLHRAVHAGFSPLITRSDDGHRTANLAMLFGTAAGAALTPTYYPPSNRNFHDVASVYGGSIGGYALGFLFDEFEADLLAPLHRKHDR